MKIQIDKWILTDPATNQKGRKLAPGKYQFTEDTRNDGDIILSDYSISEIETSINAFGYTLHPSKYEKGCAPILSVYPDIEQAEWIIAECIYEDTVGFDDDYDPENEREANEMREEQDAFDREMYG